MLAAITALFVGLAFETQAQQRERGQPREGRGGDFNPEQMRERMNERIREQLEIKSDDEWRVIQPRLQRVTEARREAGGMGGAAGMFARQGGASGQAAAGGRGGAFGGQPSPAAQALQEALDSNASAEQLKTRLANLRKERQEREAELQKAEDELKKVLNLRQEARLVRMGVIR
jgi:hypothetical protein